MQQQPFYNTNLHLNPTNVCVYRCRFCAFRADLRADKAYTFDEPMVRQRAQEARQAGATEIHVVGGLHHQKKFEWYVDIVRILKDEYPELHVKAWTPVEIAWFSFLTKKPIAWVLEQMIEAQQSSAYNQPKVERLIQIDYVMNNINERFKSRILNKFSN